MNNPVTTSADLLQAALAGQGKNRCPCICPGGMMNMMTVQLMDLAGIYWPEAHSDPVKMARLAAAAYANGLFDNIGVPFCMTVEAEAMGARVDLGSRSTEPHVVAYAIPTAARWQELSPLNLTGGRAKTVLDALAIVSREYPDAAIMGNLTGPISLAASLVDADVFYKELRKLPREAHALMEAVTDGLLAFGLAQIEAGAQFITISDPSGTGEILGPKLFEEFALPALNRLCRALRPRCKGVVVHICGQLRAIYPQLSQLDCQAMSVDAMVNVRELREHMPGRAVMGNVSTFALAAGQADSVRRLCRTCLSSGVDILAPACGLGTTTTVDSIRMMMTAAREALEEGTAHED